MYFLSVPVVEWLLYCGFSGRRAAGAGALAAGFAALHSYVGQVASSEPAERLTETKR